MKVIEVQEPLQDWLDKNGYNLHVSVLEACEESLVHDSHSIDVVILKTKNGITKFIIKNPSSAIHSLELAMNNFVEVEDYELAARARDCIISWKEKINKPWQNQ